MSTLKIQSKFKPEKEKTIAELADKMGLKIKLPCDGKGKCGKCLIKIIKGEVNDPTKDEEKHLKKSELEDGIRLACCVIPKGDVTISQDLKDSK
jgi:ferredoxin